jgi:hypothetical protein
MFASPVYQYWLLQLIHRVHSTFNFDLIVMLSIITIYQLVDTDRYREIYFQNFPELKVTKHNQVLF